MIERIRDICNWRSFSTYRDRLFGIAILFILLFHSTSFCDYGSLNKFIQQMNMGVEIFLFLSGMGLYFSYNRIMNQPADQPIKPLLRFYKRRFITVMGVYAIISLPFCVWQNIVEKRNILYFLFDWSTLSYWFKTENSPGWYVSLILVLYLLYPLIYRLLFGYADVHIKHIVISFAIELFFIGCIYFLSRIAPVTWLYFERAFTRIPVFILGCCCGKFVYDKKAFTARTWFFMLLCLVSMFFLNRVNWRLRYFLAVIPIMLIMIILCHLLIYKCRLKFVDNTLSFFGSITLELYLIHNYLSEILQYYGFRKPVFYILVLVFSIPASYMLAKIRVRLTRATA